MLPTIASYKPRQIHRHNEFVNGKRTLDVLRSRARVTNLGFLLLITFCMLSALFNLNYYISSARHQIALSSCNVPNVPAGVLSTISRDKVLENLTHLVMVPCHAIWKGTRPEMRLEDDEWILESYQRGGGRVATFFDHITHGVKIALDDERSLLVFSGGQTRPLSTSTEAESYLRLALASGLLPDDSSYPFFLRATTEEHALDSYQNVLFSVARFHEYTGRYPEKITVVGYEMKRRRFTELHRAALRWPSDKFHYIGIDPPEAEATKAREGELQNGYLPYTRDLYGCHSGLLAKRKQRNLFVRYHPYHSSASELRRLLDWCPGSREGGQTVVFDGALPWNNK